MRLILLLVIGLLAILLWMRHRLYRSRLSRDLSLECQWTGGEFAAHFLQKMGRPELLEQALVEYKLSGDAAKGQSAADLAEAAWWATWQLMATKQGAVLLRRERVLFRAKILPGLSLMVLVLAVLSLKMPAKWSLFGGLVVLIITQVPAWMSQNIDAEVSQLAIKWIQEKHFFSRIRDEEKVCDCLRALAWKRLLPF